MRLTPELRKCLKKAVPDNRGDLASLLQDACHDIDELTAELASVQRKLEMVVGACVSLDVEKQAKAIEAAAYRKAAIKANYADQLAQTIKKNIEELITPSAQSALEEMIAETYEFGRQDGINQHWGWPPKEESAQARKVFNQCVADREKRAQETALRWAATISHDVLLAKEVRQAAIDASCDAILALRDTAGSPSPRLYTEAEVTERVRKEAEWWASDSPYSLTAKERLERYRLAAHCAAAETRDGK